MLIKEYRIPMPMSVEEYRIAQLYMIQVRWAGLAGEGAHGGGQGPGRGPGRGRGSPGPDGAARARE